MYERNDLSKNFINTKRMEILLKKCFKIFPLTKLYVSHHIVFNPF